MGLAGYTEKSKPMYTALITKTAKSTTTTQWHLALFVGSTMAEMVSPSKSDLTPSRPKEIVADYSAKLFIHLAGSYAIFNFMVIALLLSGLVVSLVISIYARLTCGVSLALELISSADGAILDCQL